MTKIKTTTQTVTELTVDENVNNYNSHSLWVEV